MTPTSYPATIRSAAALAASLALVVLGTSACGNVITVHDAGRVGITVDPSGNPVIAVMSCHRATPVIQLSEGRTDALGDDQPNVERGSWQATAAFSGVRTIALTSSDARWTRTGQPGTLETDRLFIAGGGTTEDEDANLMQVTFRISDLAGLTPDQVRIETGIDTAQTVSMAGFGAYRCR